jgi:fatty acid amide hydrolase 2
MTELLTSSALHLAKLIRTRAVSAREVVHAHILRSQTVNPALNAIVDERYQAALAEADAADATVARAPEPDALPPFWGVPITVKECIGVEGLRKTSGLTARKQLVAGPDGSAVARLRRAGAIPLGVTNVSELMMWMETFNPVYGRTNNPYDISRTVGGSSGGEGAIVGAGGSPMGLGADIGGSIRMPAFFNGVFGHKATGGLVPATGHWPMPENAARRFNATGPICRRAEDLMPFLRVVAGPDGIDGGCYEIPLGDPATVALSELIVYDVEDNGAIRVSDELRAAQRDVAAHLSSLGARVETLRVPAFKHTFDMWSAMMDEAAETKFSVLLGNGTPVRAGVELLRWAGGRRHHTLPALMLAFGEKLPGLLGKRAERALDAGRRLKGELTHKLGPRGILLYPPYPSTAPRHYRAMMPPLNWQYTAIFNILEFPATAVPLGLNATGLPLGIQVASVPGNDHVTIAVAEELERRFGGWVPPVVRT